MAERIQTTANRPNSGTKKTWVMVIGGTAVLLVAAGIMLQVMRPTAAFPGVNDAKTPAGKAPVSERKQQNVAVAKVNTQVISYDELAAEAIERHAKEILENLINRLIILQACEAQGIEVSEAEVNAEVNKIATKFGLAVDQWEKMLQAERNVTPQQYRRDIIWPMLALKKLAGEDVKITKSELKQAFERHYGERVKARAIIMDNFRRIRDVHEQVISDPDNFANYVRKHSVDPTSRALDGTIPPIARHGGSKELETAAFKLKEGEISPVIQLGPNPNQFIIIKCEGRTEQTVKELVEVQDVLADQLREEKVQESVAKVFEKLKSEARVDNYLTQVSTGGTRKSAGAKTSAKPGAIRPASGTSASTVDEEETPPVRTPRSATPKTKSRPAAE